MENQKEIIVPAPTLPQKDVAPTIPQKNGAPSVPLVPVLPVTNCNTLTVRQLKCIYAGRYSAFTNLSLDTYGQIFFATTNADLSKLFEKFIQEDLQHINTLGGIILNNGGNARFTNGQGSPWSARYLNYSNRDLLNSILLSKQTFNRNLNCILQKNIDANLKSILTNIYDQIESQISQLQPYIT